jgi:hypothetical protein
MAFLDGVLGLMLLGVGFSWLVYVWLRADLNRITQSIHCHREAEERRAIEVITDPAERKQAEKQLNRNLKTIATQRDMETHALGEMSKLVGIGTFAFPPAGIALLVGAIASSLRDRR